MKFNIITNTATFLSCIMILSVSSTPIPVNLNKRDTIDPSLIPQFGVQPGANPTGTGNCDGIQGPNGQVVKIPCSCPPDRNTFIQALNANVNAGHAINNPSITLSFPTGNSKNDQLARINAASITLQNLNGTGVGCPAASTTFVAQQKAIQDGTTTTTTPPPPAGATVPAPAPQQNAPSNTTVVDPALVPDLGVQSGQNPTGTGGCDGIDNAAGQPIKIPCSCPPDRNTFIQALNQNVAAGHAVNNPSVVVAFPTDDSNASKLARIQASLVTLQNLKGPGVGCPAASTTLLAQLKSIQ